MSDSSPNPPVEPPLQPTPIQAKTDPVQLFSALGSDARWFIVRMLADGRAASVTDIAKAIGWERDVIAKQLRVMSRAGVLESRDGADRRQTVYQIPTACRPSPGVVDYGFCVLHLDKV